MKIQEIFNTLMILGCFVLLLAIANQQFKPAAIPTAPASKDSLPLMRGGYVVDQITFWNSAYGAGYNAGYVDAEKKH